MMDAIVNPHYNIEKYYDKKVTLDISSTFVIKTAYVLVKAYTRCLW